MAQHQLMSRSLSRVMSTSLPSYLTIFLHSFDIDNIVHVYMTIIHCYSAFPSSSKLSRSLRYSSPPTCSVSHNMPYFTPYSIHHPNTHTDTQLWLMDTQKLSRMYTLLYPPVFSLFLRLYTITSYPVPAEPF